MRSIRIAEENGFPSRQASKQTKEPRRKPHLYRTGRHRQINLKVSDHTAERLYKLADERKVPLGALLEQALDAIENAGPSRT